jgi:glycosyltransferase involved in cell wall biosynthesis
VKVKKLVSIIVPVLNEEQNIKLFYEALTDELNKLNDIYDFEIIFTDNHSYDSTFDLLRELNLKDNKVKAYRFSRNYGYQHSILTGYQKSSGEAVIQLDCDLQDPPSLIPVFLNLWQNGYKVVYGVRKKRQENIIMNYSRKVFYRLINWMSEDDLPVDAGDFRLVDKKIVEVLRNNNDAQPYLRGAIASMGFNQIGVEYDRSKRANGETKFTTSSLINIALDGILNHSTIPLRISSIIGIIIGLLTIIVILGFLIGKLMYGMDWPAGFATIVILLLVTLSINAIFLGIMGEYIGRIYKQSKGVRVIVEDSIK